MSTAAIVGVAAVVAAIQVVAATRGSRPERVGPRLSSLWVQRPRLGLRLRRRLRAVAWWRLGLAVAAVAYVAPIAWQLHQPTYLVFGGNDLSAHAAWASEVTLLPPGVPIPHFALHVVARIAMVPLGLQRADAGIVVAVAAFTAWGAWLLAGWLAERVPRGVGTWWAAVATLALVVGEAPNVIWAPVTEIGGGSGYVVLHLLGTPTNAVLLPVVVLLLPQLVRAADAPLSRRAGVVLAVTVAFGMTAKPSAPIVLVPAALLVVALSAEPWRARASRLGALALWSLAPLLVIAVLQTWWYQSGLAPEDDGGFRIAPLHEMRIAGALRPAFWIGMVIPCILLAAAGGRWWRDRAVQLGLAAFAVGLVQFALLGETGARRDHGNWGISFYVGVLLLFVTSTGWALQRLAPPRGSERPVGRTLVVATAGVVLVAGAVAWLDAMGLR